MTQVFMGPTPPDPTGPTLADLAAMTPVGHLVATPREGDPRVYLDAAHPTAPVDPVAEAPHGMAAALALQCVAEMARGLQVLNTEVRIHGRLNRHGEAEVRDTFDRLARVLQVMDHALPLALAPARAFTGQVADAIAAEFTTERSRQVGFGDPDVLTRDIVEFTRHLLDPPPADV